MNNLQPLTKVLEESLILYKEYYMTASEKNLAIVNTDFTTMDNLLKAEQKIALKITTLERERVEIFQSFPKNNGELHTLKTLINSQLDTIDTKKLDSLRNELLKVTKKIGEVNNRNLELTKKSLEIVDFTLKTITDISTSNSSSMYNGRGFGNNYSEENSSLSLVDVKI